METTSFWNKVPLPSFLTVIWTMLSGSSSADGVPKRLASSSQPEPTNYKLLTDADADAVAVADFLRANYLTGSTNEHPISIISASDLWKHNIRTVYLQQSGTICGAISSLPLGNICRGSQAAASAFNLRLIQNFCVTKHLRSQGIGSRLLHAIWADTKSINEDATIFLKEGAQLLHAGPALYTSRWVYRRCLADECAPSACQQIPSCSPETDALIADFARRSLVANRILYNNPKSTHNTIIILYKGMRGQILSAFSSAKQIHPSDRRSIWYQTGWLEQGTILPTERQFAANHISSKCASITGCGWIWIDISSFAGATVPSGWKYDGPFQYYAFHWTADLYNNAILFLRF
jgi:hypothetical protein